MRAALRATVKAGLDDDPFVILQDVSDFCQGYVQAMNTEEGWWVEFRPLDGKSHYRLPDAVNLKQAGAVFVAFLEKGAAIEQLYPWVDVTVKVQEAIKTWAPRIRKKS
jgi:hypothetical protein